MKILSPHCIQLPTVEPEKILRVKNILAEDLRMAMDLREVRQTIWNSAAPAKRAEPLTERRFCPSRVMQVAGQLTAHGIFEVINSRYNAVMSCGDVTSHVDGYEGWTWLTYLSDENESGEFHMEATEKSERLILPVKSGTSFCFDHARLHGFRIDLPKEATWVPFLSILVTVESVREILEQERTSQTVRTKRFDKEPAY